MRRWLTALALGLAMFIGGGALVFAQLPPTAPPTGTAVPFALTAADGATVADQTYRGKWLLVYFGYTHCPDVCPTTLSEIAVALDRLSQQANRLQPLFITLDPRRDTKDVLADYVKAFDARIVGLTGTPQQIAAAARTYQVFYERVDRDDDDYLIDHSSYLYVVNPDGRFVTAWPSDRSGERVARDLDDLMRSR